MRDIRDRLRNPEYKTMPDGKAVLARPLLDMEEGAAAMDLLINALKKVKPMTDLAAQRAPILNTYERELAGIVNDALASVNGE